MSKHDRFIGYHVIQETKSGNRIKGHPGPGQLKEAIEQVLHFKRGYITRDVYDWVGIGNRRRRERDHCEEIFRITDGVYSGITEAVALANQVAVRPRRYRATSDDVGVPVRDR
jgi:hypothetical protein